MMIDPVVASFSDSTPVARTSITLTKHPLDRDQAVLPTLPLDEFVNVLNDWLDSRLTGAIVWGNQRVGKSEAIKYLKANGAELLGCTIPMGSVSVSDPSATALTENRFFGALLAALNYASPQSGTAAVKRHRLIDLIQECVASANEYRFLLFIDEAQWLANIQYRYLMDLHNQLKIADVHLVCILVGQPELLTIRQEMRNAKQAHLLGRFMGASHQFTGVCNDTELNRIAHALDALSEFPVGSGVSYTQHYVPMAFSNGWRMEQVTPLIWKVLDQVLEAENLPKCPEIPMNASMALIVWLLHQLAKQDSPNLELDPLLISEGVYRRALIPIKDNIELYVG